MKRWITRRTPVVLASLLAAASMAAMPLAATAAPAVTTTSCVSRWYMSSGGTASYVLLHTDTSLLPLSDLAFSRSYNDPTDLSRGYLDFDRDGKSDVFAAKLRSDGKYQWMYSSGGTSAWINLKVSPLSVGQIRFGDFNGDGYTDIFFTTKRSDGSLQWKYFDPHTSTVHNLIYVSTPLSNLRFGDFNGDGRTDVFTLVDLGNGYYGWMVSYGGAAPYSLINSATTRMADMQFGDINGDGHTDLFTTVPGADQGNFDWLYSSAGTGAYQTMLTTNMDVHHVSLNGDYDGDHVSDFFFTTVRNDGAYQWWYFYYHTNPYGIGSVSMAYDTTNPSLLRFADFNGDGLTDVFDLIRTC